MKKRKSGKFEKVIKKSPINYFSDLFVASMVICWVVVLGVMVVFAIYATVALSDVTMWTDIAGLVGIPLSCGGAIWMIKNTVQHSIANKQGKQVEMDFPAVDASEEIYGQEKPMNFEETESDDSEDTESEEEYG